MMESSRFLITTSDERSWRCDLPIVFLGEWCRRYDRLSHWSGLDAVVARSFCPTGELRDKAAADVGRVSLQLLAELGSALNRQHGLNSGARFWRILLGHWIHRLTSMLFHRWHAVRQLLDVHKISGTIVFENSLLSLAVPDTDSFTWACNDPQWNNLLVGDLLRRNSHVPIETLPVSVAEVPHREPPQPGGRMAGAARLLQKDTDALILHSYLPRATALGVCLGLLQVPQQRRSPPAPRAPPDAALRTMLKQAQRSIGGDSASPDFEVYARDMLFELLPTCFLEGFGELHRQVDALDWPRRPRFIFTSNSFDTDEVFKLWTAQRVGEGRPYFIGQHGNNYGTARFCPSETECIETSDKFITWGWKENKKCEPAFIFKTANRRQPHCPGGDLLLIELCLPHRLLPWDPYPEFATYQQDQFEFASALPDVVRARLMVRLHAEHRRQPWCEEQRWQERDPQIRLDTGTRPVTELIATSRLVVHSYDSTGILETLSLDVPTVCFWNGGLEHLRESARPFYLKLFEAGILHLSSLDAARHVTEVWGNVEEWWGSAPVQTARTAFCARYARHSPAPARELLSLLGRAAVR
jgi:putative transferase (TIGR04331 family)